MVKREIAQDSQLLERPIGETLASDPLSVSLVLLHETRNMMASILTAAPGSFVFQGLSKCDQNSNAGQREQFFTGLGISPSARLTGGQFLKATGGFEQPILPRMLVAIPAALHQSLASHLEFPGRQQITFNELRTQIFLTAVPASNEFLELTKQLGLAQDPMIAHYVADWESRLRDQKALMLAQESQIIIGEPPSSQLELIERGREEILKMIEGLERILGPYFFKED